MISNKYHQFFFSFHVFLEKQLVVFFPLSCSVKSGKPQGKNRVSSVRIRCRFSPAHFISFRNRRYFRRGEISFLARGQPASLNGCVLPSHTGDIGHATETLSQPQANIERINQQWMGQHHRLVLPIGAVTSCPFFLSCTANVAAPCRAEPCV